MAKCYQLTPLPFKGLKDEIRHGWAESWLSVQLVELIGNSLPGDCCYLWLTDGWVCVVCMIDRW